MISKKTSSPVSFRLSANLKEELDERAAELGLSPGEYSRKVVIESLRNDFEAKVLAKLERILLTSQAAREDFETATLGLMITAGNQPIEIAEAWLKANLRTEV